MGHAAQQDVGKDADFVLVGHREVIEPFEQLVEGNQHFLAAEHVAYAHVRSLAEGEVGAGIGAFNVELVGIGKALGIAVGRGIAQLHHAAGRDRHAAKLGIGLDDAPHAGGGCFVAQRLFNEVADHLGIAPACRRLGLGHLIGVADQLEQPACQCRGGGFIPRHHELLHQRHDFRIDQRGFALDPRFDQIGQQIIAAIGAAIIDQALHVMLEFDEAARAFLLALEVDHLAETVDRSVGPHLDLLGVVIEPDLSGDHGDGQRHAEFLDKLAMAAIGEGFDQLDRFVAHVGFDRVDARGREGEVDQLAVAGVDRVIGGQQCGQVRPAFGQDRLDFLVRLAPHQRGEVVGENLRLGGRLAAQIIAVDDIGIHALQQLDLDPGLVHGAVVIERVDQRFGGKHIAFGLVHDRRAPTLGFTRESLAMTAAPMRCTFVLGLRYVRHPPANSRCISPMSK